MILVHLNGKLSCTVMIWISFELWSIGLSTEVWWLSSCISKSKIVFLQNFEVFSLQFSGSTVLQKHCWVFSGSLHWAPWVPGEASQRAAAHWRSATLETGRGGRPGATGNRGAAHAGNPGRPDFSLRKKIWVLVALLVGGKWGWFFCFFWWNWKGTVLVGGL